MDDDNSLEPKNNSKMAELFMECEEEELQPWQRRVEETRDEDDDELIFVGEISSSKPAISNILNRGNSSSSTSKTIKSETLSQDTPKSSLLLKRPSSSEVNPVTPKKPKIKESISDMHTSTSVTPSHVMPSQGTNTSASQNKIGTPFQRACPNCNAKFNLLDPLKYHMKYCCPDIINNVSENNKAELSNVENKNKTDSEKGKLIMLVSDFYYGRHGGRMDQEKTYTTFKCFSCLKVLKNNIRFMNHMKHHLEFEKQNSESWENHTTCQHCYRQYPTPFQLQCHIESTHTPHEFSTICKICELSFESEHTLLQHMKDTHKPGEMPYICQVCQYRSSCFSEVDTHFRTFHENTKNLLCPFCLKVSRMATPFMNHYMKHQKKGIHRCAKCRLQFLTCKEKTDHKIQHRTFLKPRELEGLPPGTKVTIRASLGHGQSQQSQSTPLYSSTTPSTSLQVSPPNSKTKATKNTPKSTTVGKQKKPRSRKSKISTALKNLRCRRGAYGCIECRSKIKDFASHFSTNARCNVCKYNTNCNEAFINHMVGSHSNHPSKRFCLFKKNSGTSRGITLVCLNCDFLVDSSALDLMAKHLSQRKTHTCQVIKESEP
ncbi:PREDICTED: zinc finger protein 280C [Chrysochloris asiatica]|uniref:Zinc finger protein 280C n=1 Tax=Chrysochloris asiatica TaxID=185453 RepID=A0A9B0TDC9_CHRAS|nr:PREDICTED: zinc finger protein 280C [Chrysochloris asiatica]